MMHNSEKNEDYESSLLYFYHHVWCKKFIYCKYPGISDLRKYLNELSPVLLRDEAEVSWGVTSEQDGERLIQNIVVICRLICSI